MTHWLLDPRNRLLGLVVAVVLASHVSAQTPPAPAAARVDPYVECPRVFVLTDIANEPDDQMSLVRFLVYANHFDIEGLVATTSTWLKGGERPDVLHAVVDAYADVQPALARHAPGFPAADAVRARQVLRNLLTNASRHTPAGGTIALTARCHHREVHIDVRNTGSTLTDDQLAHVFDRFYRADPSRQRSTGGTGLELAIVKTLVEAQGGRVCATATDDSVTFRIVLPRGSKA